MFGPRTGEDGEHAITDQFQHIAAGGLHRTDDRFGVIIDQRHKLIVLDQLGQVRIAGDVGEPEYGVDPLH